MRPLDYPEHEDYGTKVGRWICEELWPWFMRGVGTLAGWVVIGICIKLGFALFDMAAGYYFLFFMM